MTTNPTTNLRLSRPNFNQSGWHDDINRNFTLLDIMGRAIGFPLIDAEWANDTLFEVGTRVLDTTDATYWICNIEHTSNLADTFENDRTAHPTYWAALDVGVAYRGAWYEGAIYSPADVFYNVSESIVAIAITNHTASADLRADITANKVMAIADLDDAVTTAVAAAATAAASAALATEIVAGDLAAIIHGAGEKTDPVSADEFLIWNSATTDVSKVTFSTIIDETQAAVEGSLVVDFGDLTGVPTTISGYGITDAYTDTEVDALIAATAANIGKRGRVRVATTANIVIASALNNGDTLDGVTLVTGDQVLVKNQTDATQNGIYVVGVSPAYAEEYDAYNDYPGSLIGIAEGTTGGDTVWLCTSNTGGTLGSTTLAFTKLVITGELLTTDIGVTVQAYDADTAKLDVADQVVTGGARVTPLNLGTFTTGTVTPDPGDRPMQYYTNGGAHTLAPGSNKGYYVLEITNNASAGAITTSGFTKVVGSFTTTDGHKFLCSVIVSQTYSLLSIQALQ